MHHFQNLIIFEDNHLMIVNKPSGVLVQADASNQESIESLAKDFIKIRDQKPGSVYLGIPHRIDRPTSGLVILCKTSKSLIRVNDMFQKKEIYKTYWAIIEKGNLADKGHWKHYLKRSEKNNKSFVKEHAFQDYKLAELKYEILSKGTNYQLVSIQLLTGRHHQIRAQFSHMGFPLKGDNKYGFKRSNIDQSIDLHAYQIEMTHPITKEKLLFKAPIREDQLWLALAKNLG